VTQGTLTLSERGEMRSRTVEHYGAHVSWALSAPGAFSALLPADVARAYGFSGANAAGTTWVRFQYPGLPDWGGVVTQPVWHDDGSFELGCESFHVLMRKRRVPRMYGQQSAPAGALAQRAFRDVQADDYMFIKSFSADEDGAPLKWEWRGGDLVDDVFKQLSDAADQEWDVDADRNAFWRIRLGANKAGSVMLYHPHEIVGYTYTGDLWTVANDIEGLASDQRHERSAHEFLTHHDSAKQLGRYQVTTRYEGVVNKETLRPLLRRDVRKTAWPAETMELTTINVGASWGRYVCGDTIQVCLPSANAIRTVRIIARSVDVEAGTESLGVEVENEKDGWT
jgi:hypothetical protein